MVTFPIFSFVFVKRIILFVCVRFNQSKAFIIFFVSILFRSSFMAEIELKTAPADYRFPTTNQSRHCFTRYVEFHRCVAAKGDDASECEKFAKFYRSLCPGEWVDRWNEQRENGIFPGPL
ncbi:putative cytochrome-c oxidase [Helianthus annuus]|nr:putative cytochrome-c oxidase [Helianthus annuus]KAJ0934270.1 putative cytochrome-c oxidase [Helianthus annuus]KAJ0942333.1 putative cytochrome-c oxidase [Helianthus annuus]